jgi:hypothetical protein
VEGTLKEVDIFFPTKKKKKVRFILQLYAEETNHLIMLYYKLFNFVSPFLFFLVSSIKHLFL